MGRKKKPWPSGVILCPPKRLSWWNLGTCILNKVPKNSVFLRMRDLLNQDRTISLDSAVRGRMDGDGVNLAPGVRVTCHTGDRGVASLGKPWCTQNSSAGPAKSAGPIVETALHQRVFTEEEAETPVLKVTDGQLASPERGPRAGPSLADLGFSPCPSPGFLQRSTRSPPSFHPSCASPLLPFLLPSSSIKRSPCRVCVSPLRGRP